MSHARAIWITKVTWGFLVAPLNATKCWFVPVCVPVVSWSFSAAGEKVSAEGWEGGQSGPWGLRTKSHFIPNQVLKSAPILGSPGTSARLWSAFTFGLHDNIWLVYRWKSMVSLSQPWVHVSCLRSQLGNRWPRTRNVGLILMIKPQCFVGTVNWKKKKKPHTSYYDLKAWFFYSPWTAAALLKRN